VILDEDDLYILRKCENGPQQFKPEAEMAEAGLKFDRWGDRILGLRERGLLDFSDGMVMRNHQTRHGKYEKIIGRGVTEAGRREIKRHEPPADSVRSAVRKKVEQEFLARGKAFGAKLKELQSKATMLGASKGSRYLVAAVSAVEEEYVGRAHVVLGLWRQVIEARQLAFTPVLADLIREEATSALSEYCGDLESALEATQRLAGRRSEGEGPQELLDRALKALNADVEFALIAPGAPPPERGNSGHQFTIYGNVGALQTGDQSSANVTMYLGPAERESVLTELRELRRLVLAADLPENQRLPLAETVSVALAEAEKPAPNALTLKSFAMGIAMAIQTVGSMPEALQVAHRLAALLGLQF
jgi:hypothetical protein